MTKNVLIVDDDPELLLILKDGLEKYSNSYSVFLAGDGQAAIKKMESNTIAIVIADLKMPRMDGFTLLAYITEHHPETPVIIITGYGTPKMKKLVQEGGATGYLEKPFMIEDLIGQMSSILKRQSEGGILQSVSPGMFLQLVEMEQKSCTIRITEKESGNEGVLFFQNGELLDAKTEKQQGENAAYKILSWDNVSISIQNTCSLTNKKIKKSAQAILMEAMRQKDESGSKEEDAESKQDTEAAPAENKSAQSELRTKLQEIGVQNEIEDIYQDHSFDKILSHLQIIGSLFASGGINAAYVIRKNNRHLFLVPGEKTSIINVTPKAPRDKILNLLSS